MSALWKVLQAGAAAAVGYGWCRRRSHRRLEDARAEAFAALAERLQDDDGIDRLQAALGAMARL